MKWIRRVVHELTDARGNKLSVWARGSRGEWRARVVFPRFAGADGGDWIGRCYPSKQSAMAAARRVARDAVGPADSPFHERAER